MKYMIPRNEYPMIHIDTANIIKQLSTDNHKVD